jgi:probable FeS assembly SUF system protein SufT
MHEQTTKTLLRDCPATRIPSGETITLPKDSQVYITQALGGSYTVSTDHGLARIADENADALGIAIEAKTDAGDRADLNVPVDEKAVWEQLRSCYDPEIPVNIVDLGLVYDCVITPSESAGSKVDVKMTLTAPGCGMGPTIAAEAKAKILGVPGVGDAEVELVWDPPWNQAMISEAGQMKLGLI